MKHTLLATLLVASLTLVSCTQNPTQDNTGGTMTGTTNTGETSVQTGSTAPSGSVADLVATLAPIVGKTAQDVVPAEIALFYEEEVVLNGFSVTSDSDFETQFDWDNVNTAFDGWIQQFYESALVSSQTRYYQGRMMCQVRSGIDDTDMPEEVWEDQDLFENYINTALYSAVIACAELPDSIASMDELNFSGGGNEPFWSIAVHGDSYTTNNPENTGFNDYIVNATRNGDNYYITGIDSTQVTLIKEQCFDGMSENEYDYSVEVVTETETLLGCARALDPFFTNGRAGNFDTLWSSGRLPVPTQSNPPIKNARYHIGKQGHFVHVSAFNDAGEEYNIIFGDYEEPEVYWEGHDESIDDAVCEATKDVIGLHEFSLFWNCPRG